jgi:lipopolysaccharide export system protein LptA
MKSRSKRAAACAALTALAWGALALECPLARAQNAAGGPGLAGSALGSSDQPIHIEAERGIEWQQSNRLYIARGHALASRGQSSVHADTLYAYYRQTAGPQTPGADNTPRGDKPAAVGDKPAAGANVLMSDSSTEIYRLEAVGNVRFANPTQTAYGDHAVYDVDQAVMVMTGKNLRLETDKETVTARDSLEWYDQKQIAVARGDAVAVKEGKSIRGDTLVAEVERPENQPARIHRVDAYGNVIIASADQIAQGDQGVYNLDTGIATLTGRVSVTKGDNELRGQYGVVDTNNNVSRVLATPPDTASASGGPRVEGLLIPNRKPGSALDRPGQAGQ